MKLLLTISKVFLGLAKHLIELLLVCLVFMYIFSGFGILFAGMLLEPLSKLPYSHPGWIISLIVEICIVISWVLLLRDENLASNF